MSASSRKWIGTRIGSLTVKAPTDERKKGYMIWRCQCDCGNEILLDTRTLQRETIRDCGCRSKVRPGQKDLTGRRFGKLICLFPEEETQYESVIWRCICDCGNECTALRSQLTSGKKKSCGCLGHPPLKEFIGRRFGRLTVTGYAGKSAGMHRWKCQCECGNEVVIGQTSLQSGKTRSCGCFARTIGVQNLGIVEGTSVKALERSISHKLNARNRSGYVGVYEDRKTGKWIASITFKSKKYYLGKYSNKDDAVKARLRGEEMFSDFLEQYYSGQIMEKDMTTPCVIADVGHRGAAAGHTDRSEMM